jgi:hypothetical protein
LLFSSDTSPLQIFDDGSTMALLLQVGDRSLPDEPPKLLLNSSGRHVSSFVVYALTLCIGVLDMK